MQAVFGIDTLADGLTPRRMLVLLRRIPPGPFFPRHDHPSAWSEEAHLLASVIDSLGNLIWMTAQANSPKRRVPRPKPVTRPGARKTMKVSAVGLADALAGVEGVRGR